MADEVAYLWVVAQLVPAAGGDTSHPRRLAVARPARAGGRALYQHMQKALTSMNVQLSNVISDIGGVSGTSDHRAILEGERNPGVLARLRGRRIKASEEEVMRSLEGNWHEDQIFELPQAMEEYDFRQKQWAQCDAKLKAYLAVLPSRPEPAVDRVAAPPAASGTKKKKAKKIGGGNAPQSFDLAAELKRVTGRRKSHDHPDSGGGVGHGTGKMVAYRTALRLVAGA